MRRFAWISAGVLRTLALAFTVFVVWAYRPVPTFEPLAYSPQTPLHWPTQGWRRSTPEAQGMRSSILLDMVAFYREEARATQSSSSIQ